MLSELICILEQVTTNAYALNKIQSPRIIDLIIELVPAHVDNYVVFGKLINLLDLLFKMSDTDQRSIEKSMRKIIVEFYASDGKIESKLLFGIISVLKVINS